jgi:hypothetical protein
MPDKEMIEIVAKVIKRTEKAILINDGSNQDIWIPLSQIEIENEDEKEGFIEFLIPEWLAFDKGLI